MKQIFRSLLVVLLSLAIALTVSARVYNGGNAAGVAWDYGGVEIKDTPGIFLCSGNLDQTTGHYTPNPLARLFPDLVTDC